ncbi:MAG TPA: 30S ribosomal protein S6e, partial [Methanomicrobia archaeon]|nr:30S ribosomal protein S6e [Methanomicrobia archaeon]
MEVKLVVSYPNGKTEQKELKGDEAESFVGYKLGDTVDGGAAGVEGSLLITGGSDRDGFPMRKGVYGARRLKLLLAGGVGYHPKEDGVRRKKRVRGDTITDEIVQINTKVISAKEEAPAAAPEPAPVEEKAEEPA